MSADKTEGKIYSQKELVKLGKDLIKNGARSFLDAEIDNDAMTVMLFTSGTTAMSKAVMLSISAALKTFAKAEAFSFTALIMLTSALVML